MCECTESGQHGAAVCCFGGYQSDAAGGANCNVTAVGGPEDQASCPFDCGVPCPPFCDSNVCADGSRRFDLPASDHEVAYRRSGNSTEWLTAQTGSSTAFKLRQLMPSTTYDVRVRARNEAGWGEWSAVSTLETMGQPEPGHCLQDDAPCSERDGEVQEVGYSHAGTDCTGTPTVTIVGGNCWTNSSGGEVCGIDATAEAVVGSLAGGNYTVLVGVNVLSGGTNYSSAPSVVFTSDCAIPPAARAIVDTDAGTLRSIRVLPACVTPGGKASERAKLREYYAKQGVDGDGFEHFRTSMIYGHNYRCAWRIRPPVPEGYNLKLELNHVHTDHA